jgi:hypothetical protein
MSESDDDDGADPRVEARTEQTRREERRSPR